MDIRKSIFILISIVTVGNFAQSDPTVSSDRRVDWSVAGLLPGTSKTAKCVFKVDNYQGTDDQKMAKFCVKHLVTTYPDRHTVPVGTLDLARRFAGLFCPPIPDKTLVCCYPSIEIRERACYCPEVFLI